LPIGSSLRRVPRGYEVREPQVQRTYAGILGTSAFTVAMVRGWAAGAEPSNIVPQAVGYLLLFACLGAAAAYAALWMVEEGVNTRLRESLAENDVKKTTK
jgi:hypothetical protein